MRWAFYDGLDTEVTRTATGSPKAELRFSLVREFLLRHYQYHVDTTLVGLEKEAEWRKLWREVDWGKPFPLQTNGHICAYFCMRAMAMLPFTDVENEKLEPMETKFNQDSNTRMELAETILCNTDLPLTWYGTRGSM